MKEIEITIDENGNAEIDLHGFEGKGCAEITDKLVKSLNGDVVERKQKAAFFKPKPKAQVKQQQRY